MERSPALQEQSRLLPGPPIAPKVKQPIQLSGGGGTGSDTLRTVAGMEQLLFAHRHIELQQLELHMQVNRSQSFIKSCIWPPVMTSVGLLGRHIPKTDKDLCSPEQRSLKRWGQLITRGSGGKQAQREVRGVTGAVRKINWPRKYSK